MKTTNVTWPDNEKKCQLNVDHRRKVEPYSAHILCENEKTDLKEGENESWDSQTVFNQMSFEGLLNWKSEVSLKGDALTHCGLEMQYGIKTFISISPDNEGAWRYQAFTSTTSTVVIQHL